MIQVTVDTKCGKIALHRVIVLSNEVLERVIFGADKDSAETSLVLP